MQFKLLRKIISFLIIIAIPITSFAQLKWQNVDSLYQPLPSSVHVYFTNEQVDTAPFRAYYLIADLKDKKLDFTVDTAHDRRLIPAKFYERNNKPLLVVNCTFFSFETNQSLNVVIKDDKLLAYNVRSVNKKMGDTTRKTIVYASAMGINKKRQADVAWIKTDSSKKTVYAAQFVPPISYRDFLGTKEVGKLLPDGGGDFKKWKVRTAVGGGPVLVQQGDLQITDNAEQRFTGKAFDVKHPRTAMGYTKDGKLIILMIEGRSKIAGGATLTQEAQILKDLGCWEALNLDGGGSSCMLVNGKETIKVSDAAGQRPVPAVFIIKINK